MNSVEVFITIGIVSWAKCPDKYIRQEKPKRFQIGLQLSNSYQLSTEYHYRKLFIIIVDINIMGIVML